jgi:pyruvate-formate lyase-activating enzyme
LKALRGELADYPQYYGNLLDPSWASINLGGACPSCCTFCYTEWIRKLPGMTTEQVRKALDKISEIGSVRSLAFTGGEISMRPDLADIFFYSRALGFDEICLQTNGLGLVSEERVRNLVNNGLGSVLLSVHGSSRSTHDRLAGFEGSFDAAMKALEILTQQAVAVTTNTVICRDNIHEIEGLAAILHSRGFSHLALRFSCPIIEGAAFDNADDLMLSLSVVRSHVASAIKATSDFGYRCELGTLPACVGPLGSEDLTYTNNDLRSVVQVSPFYLHNVPRGEKSIKLQLCRECSAFRDCTGIQVEYLRRFSGVHEDFVPLGRHNPTAAADQKAPIPGR